MAIQQGTREHIKYHFIQYKNSRGYPCNRHGQIEDCGDYYLLKDFEDEYSQIPKDDVLSLTEFDITKPRILVLPIKRKWFKMIQEGTKKMEYREIKAYWITRLRSKMYDYILFKNGYSASCEKMYVECCGIWEGTPDESWFDGDCNKNQFVILLGKIIDYGKSIEFIRE